MIKSKKEKFRLLLINPKSEYSNYAVREELAHLMGKKASIHALSLPLIAAMTPDNYDIQIINEDVESVKNARQADIVGITTMSPNIDRAFELSNYFRSVGSKVVLGGPSASFMVDEVLKHADCVVVGEAEGIWEKLLQDFENNKLQKLYKAETPIDFNRSKLPRWDLVNTNNFLALPVEISRGCPYDCEFCIVTKMYGRKQRYREINDVIDEISQLPLKRFIIVDDNLTFNKKYCRSLFERIKSLNVSWFCQSSLEIANDESLLNLMAEAGCTSIVLGFESLKQESLNETKKLHNKIADYRKAIEKIHSKGITVMASFIIGFDSDTLEDLHNIYDFILENYLASSMISILSAPAGTDLYQRMKKERRILPVRNGLRCGMYPTLKFKNFTTLEIFDNFREISTRLKSDENIYTMGLGLFKNGNFVNNSVDASFYEKLRTSIIIFRIYVLTTNKYKRMLFFKMFSWARAGKIGISELVSFLLTMAGFQYYFKKYNKSFPIIREELKSLISKAST